MTKRPDHLRDLTPEEARWLDGRLSDEARRSIERSLAADPARKQRLERDREAIHMWREQAESGPVDVDAMAARVLERVESKPRPVQTERWWHALAGTGSALTLSPRAAYGYAMAAVLLMGIGLGGTWILQAHRAEATPAPLPAESTLPDPDVELLDGVAGAVKSGILRAPDGGRSLPSREDGR